MGEPGDKALTARHWHSNSTEGKHTTRCETGGLECGVPETGRVSATEMGRKAASVKQKRNGQGKELSRKELLRKALGCVLYSTPVMQNIT